MLLNGMQDVCLAAVTEPLRNAFFYLYPPRKKKSAPEDGTPACTPHIFAILPVRIK